MCKVYNSVGCLTAIESHLLKHRINDLKSPTDLIDFQEKYSATRKQIILEHSHLVAREKDTLAEEIEQLNESIRVKKVEVEQHLRSRLEKLEHELNNLPVVYSNAFRELFGELKKAVIKIKISYHQNAFNSTIARSIRPLTDILANKTNRRNYIISNFDKSVAESSSTKLQELDRRNILIEELNSLIYGALGEQKVVKELEDLSDDYILINDFTCSFDPPIYFRQQGGYIKTIQIDHLLVSPAGIFLLETKNWSEHSLNNLSLRSPVDQINRTNFALYKILADKINNSFFISRHHWGNRKVPLRNLIVLINKKPKEEFQYVKILSLKELPGYIKYFKPSFSNVETQAIANYLLSIHGGRYLPR